MSWRTLTAIESLYLRPESPTLVIGLGSISSLVLRAVCELVGGRNALNDLPLVLAHFDTSPTSENLKAELPPDATVPIPEQDLDALSMQRASYPQIQDVWCGGYEPVNVPGAGGIPMVGLLKVRLSKVRTKLEEFVDTLLKKAPRLGTTNTQVEVCIVGSLAGGTFSGSEHYVASLVDDVLLARGRTDRKISEYVFLPELSERSSEWFDAVAWGCLQRAKRLFWDPQADRGPVPYARRVAPIFLIGKGSSGIMMDVGTATKVTARYLLVRAGHIGGRLKQLEDNVAAEQQAPERRLAALELGVLTAERSYITDCMASLQLPGFLRHIARDRRSREATDQLLDLVLSDNRLQGRGSDRFQRLVDGAMQVLLEGAGVQQAPLAIGASEADMNQFERSMEDRRDRGKEQVQRNAAVCLGRLRGVLAWVATTSGEYPADDGPSAQLNDLLQTALEHAQGLQDQLLRQADTVAHTRQDWRRHAANPRRRLEKQNFHVGNVHNHRDRDIRIEALAQVVRMLHEAREGAEALRNDIRRRADALSAAAAAESESAAETTVTADVQRRRGGEELVRFALTAEQIVTAARAALPGGDWLPPPGPQLSADRQQVLDAIRTELRECEFDARGENVLARLRRALVDKINAPHVGQRSLVDWLMERPEDQWRAEIVDLFRRQVHPLLAANEGTPGARQAERIVVGYTPPQDESAATALAAEILGQSRGTTKIQTERLADPEVMVAIGGVYCLDDIQIPNATSLRERYEAASAQFDRAQSDPREAKMKLCPDASGTIHAALAEEGAAKGGA